MKSKAFVINLAVAVMIPALVFGTAEFVTRVSYGTRITSYFDEQVHLELGKPVPKKKADEYRVFIFGGSSAYGFPVADRYSIAAWLRKEFPLLLPGKTVRVMNCAWPGKASHHTLEAAVNALAYEPDLFIVYCGHNDPRVTNRIYLDRKIPRLHLILMHRSVFYRMLTTRIDKLRKWLVYGKSGYQEKVQREDALAEKLYKRTEVSDEDYGRILRGFRRNMEELVRRAQKRGVKVAFLNLPSNVREIRPAGSLHSSGLSESDLAAWEALFAEGQKLEDSGDVAGAVEKYEKAAEIDPAYAMLLYRLGLALEKLGDYEGAKRALIMARDHDAVPWRAKSSMNEAIRDLCEKNGLILIDAVGALERVSPHGILEAGTVYDDVHPSINAQQVISDEICRKLAERNVIAPEREWQWEKLRAAREDRDSEAWKVDGSLNAYRYVLQGLYLWQNGFYKDAIPELQKGLELMPKFTESYAFLADSFFRQGEKEKAAEAFRALAGRDAKLLGMLLKKYPDIRESYESSVPPDAAANPVGV